MCVYIAWCNCVMCNSYSTVLSTVWDIQWEGCGRENVIIIVQDEAKCCKAS